MPKTRGARLKSCDRAAEMREACDASRMPPTHSFGFQRSQPRRPSERMPKWQTPANPKLAAPEPASGSSSLVSPSAKNREERTVCGRKVTADSQNRTKATCSHFRQPPNSGLRSRASLFPAPGKRVRSRSGRQYGVAFGKLRREG